MSRALTRLKKDTVPKHIKKKLQQFLRELGFSHLIPKLSKSHAFWYFMNRTYMSCEVFPDDPRTPSYIVDEVRKRFEHHYTTETFQLKDSDTSLTAAEGMGIYNSLATTIKSMFRQESKIYQEFEEFLAEQDDDDNFNIICRKAHFAAIWAAIFTSSFEGYIFGLKVDSTYPCDEHGWETMCMQYRLLQVKPQKHRVELKKRHRYGYELIFNKNLEKFYHQTTTFEGKEYKLYVQSHALKRVTERLNLKDENTPYIILNANTLFDEAIHYKHSLLLPVVHSKKRKEIIGYFVGHYNDTECVLVTFLFVTQTGTPEGDKISETFSIDKAGQNYLEIVTYDQMLRSDIRDDEYLRDLFCQCGLEHLFEIEETMLDEFSNNAAFIRKTLMLEDSVPLKKPTVQ